MCSTKEHTSSTVGAATLTPKQRLRIAGITLLVELQHKISRHVVVYFSIVLRKGLTSPLPDIPALLMVSLLLSPFIACENCRPSSLPARVATRAGREEGRLFFTG